jgi:hypothetical protein
MRESVYVRNLVVSPKPFAGKAQLPWDEAVRTGTFVRGARDVFFRVELGESAGGAVRVQLVRPDGTLAVDDAAPVGTPDGVGQGHGQAAFDYRVHASFYALGTWRLRYIVDGETLADAPLRVVARPAQARNRSPNPVTVRQARRPHGDGGGSAAGRQVAPEPVEDRLEPRHAVDRGAGTGELVALRREAQHLDLFAEQA